MDTSALIAVPRREAEYGPILDALLREEALMPAPVLMEFARVAAVRGNVAPPAARALLSGLFGARVVILPFGAEAACRASDANEEHGTGKGRGSSLNMLDLMVLGCARATGRPILCTGRDFLSAGADLHPASRRW